MAELIDGVLINIGTKTYTVPPLNFKRLRLLKPEIELLAGVSGAPSAEQMDAMIQIIHSALERNYPELSKEDVEEMLDLGNAPKVLNAIMGVAGFQASGETTAVN